MAKKIKRHGKTALIFALLLVLVESYFFISETDAAAIANRQMTVDDSRPNPQAGVSYTFEGDHSGTSVYCLRVQYCTTATGSCTKPTSMITTSATKGTLVGWTTGSWVIDNATDGETKYTNAAGEAGGSDYVIDTGTITNPIAGVYYARVTTYTNVDCSTGSTDTGVAAYSIIGGVAISATVVESLTFTISDSAIGFGEIDTSNIRYTTDDEVGSNSEPGNGDPSVITLATNGAGGTTITIQDIGNGSGSAGIYKSTGTPKLIAATAPSGVAGGTESYAPYAKNDAANLTIPAGFQTGGGTTVSTSAQTFITAAGALSTNNTVDILAKAGITAATAAGAYADTLILIATPTY